MLLRSPLMTTVPDGTAVVEALPRKGFVPPCHGRAAAACPGATTLDPWGLNLRRFARLPSRVLAVSSALFIGAVGAIALASPAQATFSRISADVECGPQPGTATIE